jgi:hypothetical protein
VRGCLADLVFPYLGRWARHYSLVGFAEASRIPTDGSRIADGPCGIVPSTFVFIYLIRPPLSLLHRRRQATEPRADARSSATVFRKWKGT